MTQNSSSHVIEQIEAYLAGGLTPEELAAFEAHVSACSPCAEAVSDAGESDAQLRDLFYASHPDGAFEDRIVVWLRAHRKHSRPFLHPMVLRSAAAVAAAVLLTGTGVVISGVLDGNSQSLFAKITATGDQAESSRSIQHAVQGLLIDGTASPASDAPAPWSFRGDVAQKAEKPKQGTAGDVANQPGAAMYKTPGLATEGTTMNYWKDGAGYGGFGVNDSRGRSFGGGRQSGAPPSGTAGPTSGVETKNLSTFGEIQQQTQTGRDMYGLSFHPAEQLSREETALGVDQKNGQPAHSVDRELSEAKSDANGIVPAPGPAVTNGPAEAGKPSLALAYGDAAPPKPNEGKAPTAPTPGTPPPPSSANATQSRKVIRNGSLEFEVERFDDAVMRVTKLVDELGGFVATTDSDKLPNGHVKGTITLRVPPEHLDTLVLTLRGIGDLKSQKITAEDVTKHYTDLESELKAARAMEERLLEIIKTANGQIKDLLAAEKELGVWREKIESIEGEKRYLDNQVSLSTLIVSLYEKDIRTPAYATESEQVQMSLETEKVDDAYEKALEAIKTAKGRITQSELKQYDAGQFGATIVAAVPPDSAEQVIARLRQLSGRIAHFSRDRHQATQPGSPLPAATTQIQRDDTVLNLQIYNLANIAPRRTTTLQVAAAQVDRTYAQLVEQVRSAGGRIVTSALNKPDANTQNADVEFQVPTEKADAILDVIRGYGDVMQQDLSENPDTANVTEAKRGFHLRLVSLAAVPARETQTLQLAAAGVPQAFNDILAASQTAGARILQSDLSEQNPQDITAAITVEIPRTASASMDAAIARASQVLTRTVNRSAELDKTVDTKVRVSLSLASADRMPPRQTIAERIEVQNVERASDDLVNAAAAAGGRRIGNGELTQDKAGHVTSEIVVEVPLNKAGSILDSLEQSGSRRSKQVSFDSSVPENPLSRARIDVTFSNSAASLGGEETTWDAIRNGLSVSGRGLRWSLQMLVVGFCFVAPWVFVLWLIYKLIRRSRTRPATTAPAA